MVLTGNAKAWQGPNMVAGKTITYYLNEKRSVVEQDETTKGRVKAVIHPESKKSHERRLGPRNPGHRQGVPQPTGGSGQPPGARLQRGWPARSQRGRQDHHLSTDCRLYPPPLSGAILLDGEDITALPIHKRASHGITYLAQEPSVFQKIDR